MVNMKSLVILPPRNNVHWKLETSVLMPRVSFGMKMTTDASLNMETHLIPGVALAIGLAYLKVITFGSLSHSQITS